MEKIDLSTVKRRVRREKNKTDPPTTKIKPKEAIGKKKVEARTENQPTKNNSYAKEKRTPNSSRNSQVIIKKKRNSNNAARQTQKNQKEQQPPIKDIHPKTQHQRGSKGGGCFHDCDSSDAPACIGISQPWAKKILAG